MATIDNVEKRIAAKIQQLDAQKEPVRWDDNATELRALLAEDEDLSIFEVGLRVWREALDEELEVFEIIDRGRYPENYLFSGRGIPKKDPADLPDGPTTYRFRGEFAKDAVAAQVALARTRQLLSFTTELLRHDVPLCTIEFFGTKIDVLAALLPITDGHVMLETLQPIEQYTGEWTGEVWELFPDGCATSKEDAEKAMRKKQEERAKLAAKEPALAVK